MYKTIFQKAGLSPTQAEILEYLYTKKEDKASNIAKAIKKSRAIVYKDLDEMVDLKIIERIDGPAQVSIFRIGHPTQMEKFFDEKEKRVKKDRQQFMNYLPDMVSQYNLLGNKPGVKFYEGVEGFRKVLFDSLKSQTEILTFADADTIRKDSDLAQINSEYVKKRVNRKIKKKLILPERSRQHYVNRDPEFTEIKFTKQDFPYFNSGMQIYDNKVSFQTIEHDNIIGVLIEDKNIYTMLKTFYDFTWSLL